MAHPQHPHYPQHGGYGQPQGPYAGYPQQPHQPHPHQHQQHLSYPPQQQFHQQPPHPHQPYHQPPQHHAPQPPQHHAPPPPQPAAPAAAPGVPYIGARISLISNMNIRYEGTLYTIDTKASTVALQNVRCFGTETRGSDGMGGGGYVPPNSDIYEFIIFGGKDIKDLSVLQEQSQPTQQQQPLHDPAIISQQPPPELQQQHHEPAAVEPESEVVADETAAAPAQSSNRPARQPRADRPARGGARGGKQQHTVRVIPSEDQQQAEKPRSRQPAWGNANSSVAAVSGSSQSSTAPRQHKQPVANHSQSTEENKQEFDFESANARFENIKLHDEPSAAGSVPSYDLPSADAGLDTSGFPVVTKKYDKSKSFFDELTTDKSGPSGGRPDRRHDVDTFGDVAQNYRPKHSRGGYRGGRGGQRRQGGQGGQGGQGWRQQGQTLNTNHVRQVAPVEF